MTVSPSPRRFALFADIFAAYDDLVRETAAHVAASEKADGTAVTQLDMAASTLIVDTLQRAFPDMGVISEEMREGVRPGAAQQWVLDPVDGTASLSRGFPIWGMGVGLMAAHEALEGYLYFPALGESLMYADGTLHFNGMRHAPAQAPLFHDLRNILVPSQANHHLHMERLHGYKPRNLGSTLYHLACLALGRSDGVIVRGCYLWDIVPALAMVRGAGCEAIYLDGSPFSLADMEPLRAPFREPVIFGQPRHTRTIVEELGGTDAVRHD